MDTSSNLSHKEVTPHQCFDRITAIFKKPLSYEQAKRYIGQCLELADYDLTVIENAAQACVQEGKTTIPVLLKHLKNRKSQPADQEADGQFKMQILEDPKEEPAHAPETTGNDVVLNENHINGAAEHIAGANSPKENRPPVPIDEAFAPYLSTLFPYQKLLIDDIKKFGKDSDSRVTIMNPPTSIGKTYLIPAIAYEAHKHGCKLVYSCSTRASIQEVHKAFASGTLRDYYMGTDLETGTRKLLLIPSIKDAYINFLKPVIPKPKNKKAETAMSEPEIAEYLQHCTSQDVDSLVEVLITHDKKPGNVRIRQIYGMNAYEKIKKILTDMESGIVFSQDYAEQMDRDFSSAASAIGAILHGIYRSILKQCEDSEIGLTREDYRILAKRRMLVQYPWVGKLYPGFLYDFADVVLLTNRKLTANIDPIGISRGSMIAPVVGVDNHHWVLVDEVDRFCSDLLGDAIDRATRGRVDLKELICMIRLSIRALLEYHADDPESSKLIADPRMLPEGEAEQEQIRKALLALVHTIDTNDQKYDFIISQNRAMSYEPDVDADGPMLVPAMTVDRSHAHLIMPGYRAKKGKNQEGETVTQLILRTSAEDNRTRILKMETPAGAESESSELLYEDWCRDTFKIVTMFLPIVRKLCLFYINNFPGTTQEVAQRAVCERLTLRGAYGAYIRANLLRPWSTSVSGNHFYAHGLTWNLMDTHNALQTEINVETCNGFPDYLFANLCLNSQKAILCSATAGMKSLTMPDVQYVLKAIAGHDDDERKMEMERQRAENAKDTDDHTARQDPDDMPEFMSKDPDSLLYTMENIPKASAMLQEKRNKEYNATDFVFEYYDRTAKDPNTHPKADPACCGDVERYEEITGLKLSEQDQQNYSVCNLAFACFAMDAMLKHQIPVLLVYASPLPKKEEVQDGSCYTMSRLEEAKEAILAKHGKTGMKFKIERMDASSDKEIKREPNEYVIVLSAYSSTGAGSNITIQTKLKNGLTPPEDLRGVCCDDITNLIPGPQKRDLWDARIRYGMTATYYFYKTGELESQKYKDDEIARQKCMSAVMQHLYHGHHGGRSVLERCLTPGQEGKFKKDAFSDDPRSPFKETQRKILLQAVNRVERGRNSGEGKRLICLSNTLVEKAGISEDSYRDAAYPGCLFGYALNQIAAAQNAKIQNPNRVELELLNRCYMEKNIKNRETVNHILNQIQKAKEDGTLGLNPELVAKYERLRLAYFTGGYGDNPDIRQVCYYTEDPGFMSRYAVQIPQSDDDRERIEGARLLPIGEVRYPCDVRCRPDDMGPYGALEYHEARGWLGEGWQDDFKEVLPYLDEIRTHGYKYLPFVNMHDINVGLIYERMFCAVNRPGGVYHIGYPVIPYDTDLLEDFDLRYAGTHVVIDIKGYRTNREPTTPKKFMAKIKRYENKYGCRPVVLFINMVSGQGVNSDMQKFRHFTYLNGFADFGKTDLENSASFLKRRLALRALCDAHRMSD